MLSPRFPAGGRETEETIVGLLPALRTPWLVSPDLEGSANNLACVCQRAQQSQANGLDKDVTDGRGFNRTGQDLAVAGVGRELAEQGVLAASSHHVDDLEPMAEHFLQAL